MELKIEMSMLCGIVLAGGEGKRLQPFVNRLRGDTLPKQFVNFIGTRSMLEHTFYRAEKLIPRERLFTIVSRNHLGHREVRRQTTKRPRGTVIVQPENKETAPGLLLPLMHLYKRSPESVVVVFPSDHFILEEDLFMSHVHLACEAVERDASRLVLIGAEPNEPEPDYGYILPGAKVKSLSRLGLRAVSQFIEKPEPDAARELVLRGGLWNTMVMVFKAKTLIDLVRSVVPRLYSSFQLIWEAIGTPREKNVVEEVYQQTEPVNFSKGLLEVLSSMHRSPLSVLPVHGVLWSDWGSGQRVLSALKKIGYLGRLRGIPTDFGISSELFGDLSVSRTEKKLQRTTR
jgi:mannose-1-phosphate guanylyltransferase